MSRDAMTLEQIRRDGLEALARELGPVGLVRFLQQFEVGSGDYSTDRHGWLDDMSVSDLAASISRRRESASGTAQP